MSPYRLAAALIAALALRGAAAENRTSPVPAISLARPAVKTADRAATAASGVVSLTAEARPAGAATSMEAMTASLKVLENAPATGAGDLREGAAGVADAMTGQKTIRGEGGPDAGEVHVETPGPSAPALRRASVPASALKPQTAIEKPVASGPGKLGGRATFGLSLMAAAWVVYPAYPAIFWLLPLEKATAVAAVAGGASWTIFLAGTYLGGLDGWRYFGGPEKWNALKARVWKLRRAS